MTEKIKEITEEEFLKEAQWWVFANHKTQKAAALALGIHPQYLNAILKGVNAPTPALLKVMCIEKMTVTKTRSYIRKA